MSGSAATLPNNAYLQPGQPAGTGAFVVHDGESVESLAFQHGLLPETIWDDAGNQELRAARKDPNVLFPGDRLFIPERRPAEYDRPTDRRHTFRRKGVPSRFRLQILFDQKPQPNAPYELKIGNRTWTGRTDANGMLEHPILPDAKGGRLQVLIKGRTRTYSIRLGFLHPPDTFSGVQQRMANLGYLPETASSGDNGDPQSQMMQGLRQFQEDSGLPPTGQPDSTTLSALIELHDSRAAARTEAKP